jgi:SAM-dependent methyltransferase
MSEPDFLCATRAAYDRVAADYADRFQRELAAKPLDRALLAAYAEIVRAAAAGPVADIGCGPGHVTDHLHGLGLSVFGIDLSREMVAIAQQAHPGLRFDVGSMTALDLPDDALGGIVALYSIIHIPSERLPGVFAEFFRVLAPGGQLMLAFQAGNDDPQHVDEWFGHAVSLDAHRWSPRRIGELLGEAGFLLRASMVREPEAGAETVQRAYLLASKPQTGS